jgi:dinuclear metal center YbgI/SA1388 family protein
MKCKPTVKDIYDFINDLAPFEKQCEWDNSGLIVGNPNQTATRIGVVLDITSDAVEYAIKNKIDLIISHHPVIFRAIKSILADDPVYALARNGISAICAHTSLDIAKGGVNDALADALGFGNATPLSDSGETEMIRICETDETTADSLAKLVAEKLATCVAVADGSKPVRKIALCGGAGGSFIHDVAAAGCDAFITGEAKHHEFLEAKALGVTLISAGHFETENPVVAALTNKIEENFECEAEIIPQNSPVKYFKTED